MRGLYEGELLRGVREVLRKKWAYMQGGGLIGREIQLVGANFAHRLLIPL